MGNDPRPGPAGRSAFGRPCMRDDAPPASTTPGIMAGAPRPRVATRPDAALQFRSWTIPTFRYVASGAVSRWS